MEHQSQNVLYIDPNSFTIETYLNLVQELDKATSTKFDPETYKQADKLLTEFSKTHQAWAVTIQVLTIDDRSDKEYFHAANVLKNKMMYDFANLRKQDFQISFQIRDNLLIILKKMANTGKPQFLLNCLCTAIAVLIMHINENWPDMVEHLTSEFSHSVEEATCLLLILKYMASDCDNDSIVIEDSIRQNYFRYLDSITAQVFDQVFNQWAQKLNLQAFNQETTEDYKLQKMKQKLVDAFYNWIKLKLPEEVVIGLTTYYPELMKLVFLELENKEENLENATNCVIELIVLSRKKPEKFGSIREAVIQKVELLIGRVDQAVKDKDETLGEQYADIFVELGQTHISQIIEGGVTTIPEILLKLMSIPEMNNRRQVPFWRSLFKGIMNIQLEEEKRQRLISFEKIVVRLIDQIVQQMKADDDLFEDFNYVSEFDEQFDDFNLCCGPQTIFALLSEKLNAPIQALQQNNSSIKDWSQIECLISCISNLATTLSINEVGSLSQIIKLTFELPNDYVALRRAGANLFSSLSGIMKQHGMNAQQDLKSFVDYVILGLGNKYSIPSCSKAFQTLCIDNAKALAPYTAELIERNGISALIEEYEDDAGCQACLKRIISSFALPLMDKINSLKQLFVKEGRPLKKEDINEGIIKTIQGYLQLLGDFLKGCKKLSDRQNNPFEELFQELWTLFIQSNIEVFTHIDDIVEYTIRMVKHCLRILGRKFDKYLIPFLQLVIKAYESLADFEREPDIASDFFGMCVRYIKHNKEIVFRSQHLETLITIWKKGIGIEHPDAIHTHCEFFLVLVQTIQEDIATIQDLNNQQEIQVLWNYFLRDGQDIVDQYIQVVLGAPSKDSVDKYVDVLVDIGMKFPVEYKQLWFTQSFQRIPGNVLTEEEKQRYILKVVQPKPKFDSLLDNFDILAKRARNAAIRNN